MSRLGSATPDAGSPFLDVVAEAVNFLDQVNLADLVITGEGQIDGQTSYGKTIMGVASRAKKLNIPVLAIAGSLAPEYQSIYENGVSSVMSIIPRPMPLDLAIENAYKLVVEATERSLRMISLGMDL